MVRNADGVYFAKLTGYRAISTATPFPSITVRSLLQCAVACKSNTNCNGYNVIQSASSVTCELVTGALTVTINSSWNYYANDVS